MCVCQKGAVEARLSKVGQRNCTGLHSLGCLSAEAASSQERAQGGKPDASVTGQEWF